jgi:hypothetical protein
MSRWYGKISANPDDLTVLVDAVLYFENELEHAKHEVKLKGSVEKASSQLPGIVEHRFNQYQEVEAILKLMEIKHTQAKGKAFKHYLETYARALTSRDAERYADADKDVIEAALLINQVALIRNTYMGIMKGLEYKHWQINNIVKLKVAGLEDYDVG